MNHSQQAQRLWTLSAVVVSAVGAFLAAGAQDRGTQDLGTMPQRLVQLYDEAIPSGILEIELDRQGEMIAIEAEIALDQISASLREAALRELPGAQLIGAEHELVQVGQETKELWEVQLIDDGRYWELIFDKDGNVFESEREITWDESPVPVRTTVETTLLGGELVSVEIITRGEEREYHVKKMRDGGRYKMVIDPEGHLQRLVREAVAEVEIPVKRD